MFSPKNRQKIRQNPAKKTTMTFVLAIVKSILATQRNDFGFNKCELKSLNNVGYCGKKYILKINMFLARSYFKINTIFVFIIFPISLLESYLKGEETSLSPSPSGIMSMT